MIQEKPTSLRLLQTHKKKNFSPVIYLFVGFFSGILCTVLMFFIFLKVQSNQDVTPSQNVEDPVLLPTHSKTNTQATTTVETTQHELTEMVEDNNFAQPQSSELNKFFQHRSPPPATDSGQRISPFDNEPNAKPVTPTTLAKPIPPKNEPVKGSQKVAKPVTQPIKTAAVKQSEPEIETPQATVQIKVTQKPFAVNELH